MEMQIVDKKGGKWFLNQGQHPFQDPETGVRFSPGVAMLVKPTKWIESQPVLVAIADPLKAAEEQEAAEAAARAAAEAEAEAAAKAAAAEAAAAAAAAAAAKT